MAPLFLALAVVSGQAQTISSDISMIVPTPGSTNNPTVVTNLTDIEVTFVAAVSNVAPDDIFVSGIIATNVSPTNAGTTFTYSYAPIPEGTNTVNWNQAHAIFWVSDGTRLDDLGSSTAWYYKLVDTLPPRTQTINPAPDATVGQLTQISVLFNEPVSGVDATDLLVNGQPATGLTGMGAGPYIFNVVPPTTPGPVTISWASGHGIVDDAAAHNPFAGGSWTNTYNPGTFAGDVIINEFLASNVSGLADEDGDLEDWIEIYNRGTTSVNLLGWSLTDDENDPAKWVFPNKTLPAGGYLVVFASGKNRTPTDGSPLHTNFKLGSISGQYLALFNANQPPEVATRFLPAYPPQRADISYGLSGSSFVYLSTPTPGAPNSAPASFIGFAKKPQANVASGFFNMPFTLTLSSATPGATIRYTIDGSEPKPTSTTYAGPIMIAGTSNRPVATVRATAYGTDLLPSEAATFSYIFPSNVLHQPLLPTNFPAYWVTVSGQSYSADYEMDPQVLYASNYAPRALQALTNIPALSIVLDNTALFSQNTGIYSNPNPPSNQRDAWERRASAELILPDGSAGFRIDAGLRAQGGTSRDPNRTRKHSLRLFFNSSYDGKLKYKVFKDSSRDRFNTLVLDAGSNILWHNRLDSLAYRAQNIRDAFCADLQIETGTPCWHSRFVNLFLNGLYWGLYYVHERPDDNFAEAYYGGNNEDYDVVRNTDIGLEVVSGDAAAWNKMISLINPGSNSSKYEQLRKLLDIDRFIDYMIVNFYAGNTDWSAHNWYAIRRRVPLPGADPHTNFVFEVWDAEWTLLNINENVTGYTQIGTPTGMHAYLRNSPEYRQRFADRLQRLCFNGGPLFVDTNAPAVDPALPLNNRPGALYLQREAEIDLPIVLESARWGDAKPGQENMPFTRDKEFLTEFNWLKNSYFPVRTGVTLNQLRSALLFPQPTGVLAPSLNQFGGNVSAGFSLTMSAPRGTIYYTTNGTDPRVMYTGAIASGASTYSGPVILNSSATVMARARDGTTWSPVIEATFSVGELLPAVRFTELMYQPSGGSDYEFLELQNVGATAVDMSDYSLSGGVDFTFPTPFTLGAGDLAVLANDGNHIAWSNRYPGITVRGFYQGNLSNNGETVTLKDASGRTIVSVTYDDAPPWPDTSTFHSIEIIDVNGDPNDPANWRLSGTTNGTPGLAPTVPPVPSLRLNELMALNNGALTNGGSFPDWVEIVNTNLSSTNLSGWSLTDDIDPRKFVFPSTIVPGGGYLVVFCDSDTNAPGLHTGFGLSKDGETLALYDAQTNRVDAVSFGPQIANLSIGRINDIWQLNSPTPGAVNQPAALGSATGVKINEWLANPAAGQDDWFELYNPTAQPVALQGLYAGTATALFRITSLVFIGAGDYIQLFADEKPGGNHVDFKLPAGGGLIGLYDATSNVLDSVTYGPQTEGVSEGRYPDGSSTLLAFPGSASPAAPNYVVTTAGPRLNELLARNEGVAIDPWGGNADFIEIKNAGSGSVNLGGMRLSEGSADPNEFVFPSTNLALGGQIVVWCDGSRPVMATAGSPLNLGHSLSGSSGAAYLFNTNSQVVDFVTYGFQLPDQSIGRDGGGAWKLLDSPTPGTGNGATAALGAVTDLRINEWMANPASGSDWFELYNTNALPVDLSGLYLTDDPSIAGRTKFTVQPLSFIAGNAWVLYEADGNPSSGADHVNFKLDGNGETLLVYNTNLTLIDSEAFGVQQTGVSQGRLPDGAASITEFPSSATPGAANYLPLATVAINEVLSHTDPPLEDAIELVNLTATNVDIGGFYLSDSEQTPKKYRIGSGTNIAPFGFQVFYEYQFGGTTDPGAWIPFAFNSAHGDSAYLFSADGSGNLTGYRASVSFGAAKNGVSFGRFLYSSGVDFVAMSSNTFGTTVQAGDPPGDISLFRTGTGATNAFPLIGPVVINELMYHPISNDVDLTEVADEEFIELYNITSTNVPLYDPNATTNHWRLGGGIDFTFPSDVTLTNHSYLLVVHFDPADTTARAAFTNKYGVAPSVPIYGPYSGRLSNQGESIELYKPDPPQGPSHPDVGFVPYVLVERVNYSPSAPWPSGANGGGASLQRKVPPNYVTNYYNDPQNWKAEPPTAGGTNSQTSLMPVITLQPEGTVVAAGTPVSLIVQASGADPKSYQWQRDMLNLTGKTNDTLNLSSAQSSDSGSYRVSVSNSAGAVWSQSAILTVGTVPVILTQPVSQTTNTGSTVMFHSSATGTPTPAFQWFFNGLPLSGAISSDLTLTNIDSTLAGTYWVTASNVLGSAQSNPAYLFVGGIDTDGDGLPDSWEMANFGNLDQDGNGDYDHDGMSNRDEWLSGTSPVDPQSVLKLEATHADPDHVRVSFTAIANVGYTLQARAALDLDVWTLLLDIQPNPTTRRVDITNSTSPDPSRFYRVATPIQPASFVPPAPELFSGLYSSGSFELMGTGVSLQIYRIEATTNFVEWTPIGTVTGDLGGNFQFVDSNAYLYPFRFYRLASPPAGYPSTPQLSVGLYGSGSFELTGTGISQAIYNILATTNFVDWTPIGTVTGDLSGNFQFVDSNAFQFPYRFYRTAQ